nr:alpha/beta hydrolase [Parvularcula maris]
MLAALVLPLTVYGGMRGSRWTEWRSVGAEGIVLVEKVSARGTEHALFVRGRDAEAPLLLFLPGGPGESAVPYSAEFTGRLQDHFVVAHAEFGVGRGEPYENTPTLEEYTADVEAVLDRFRSRFAGRRVLLIGNSLGSIHALRIAQRSPGKVSGIVTIGQTVDWPEGSALSTAELQRRALAAGDAVTAEAAASLPQTLTLSDDPLMIDFAAVAKQRELLRRFGMERVAERHVPQVRWLTTLTTPTHSPREACNLMWAEGTICALIAPHPNWWAQWNEVISGVLAFDARKDVPALDVPYLAISGTEDWICPAELVIRYEEALSAPWKDILLIEGAGHYTHLDAPDRFQAAVLAFARKNGLLEAETVGSGL